MYFSEYYCNYTMKLDESLSSQSFQKIICEIPNDYNQIITKFGIICVAPTTFYNNGYFLEEKIKKILIINLMNLLKKYKILILLVMEN